MLKAEKIEWWVLHTGRCGGEGLEWFYQDTMHPLPLKGSIPKAPTCWWAHRADRTEGGPLSSHDAMDCGGHPGACWWGLKQWSARAHTVYSAGCRNYRSPCQVLPCPNSITFWQASRADDIFLHLVCSSALSLERAVPITLQAVRSLASWFDLVNVLFFFFFK